MTSKTPRSSARILDQFYTDPAVAADCVAFAKEHLGHLKVGMAIEPSAGSGAFSNLLDGPHFALDIDPKDPGIVKSDFLTWQPPEESGACLVIGNPPFGRSSRTAVKFFNHAAGFADAIAFIVPLSFRKQSIQSRLDPNFHLLASRPLPRKSFLFEGMTSQSWGLPLRTLNQQMTSPASLRQARSFPSRTLDTNREPVDTALQNMSLWICSAF